MLYCFMCITEFSAVDPLSLNDTTLPIGPRSGAVDPPSLDGIALPVDLQSGTVDYSSRSLDIAAMPSRCPKYLVRDNVFKTKVF